MTIAHPRTQPVQAWQFEDFATAPAWVTRECFFNGTHLIHDRQSGRQVVYPGEYLVRDMDGGVNFYTKAEFERAFRC